MASPSPDLLREMIKGFAQQMTDGGVETACLVTGRRLVQHRSHWVSHFIEHQQMQRPAVQRNDLSPHMQRACLMVRTPCPLAGHARDDRCPHTFR
jgi:hypothetical protein